MGYYVNVEFHGLEIKQGINPITQQERLKEEAEKSPEIKDWVDYPRLMIHRDGLIDLEDYYMKFHEEWFEALINFLKPVVTDSRIVCRGEDGEMWAYHFDGMGGVKDEGGTVFYGFDAYNEFIKQYRDKLPEKLVRDLKAWRTSEEL